MHYRIVRPADPHAERILKEVMSWLKGHSPATKLLGNYSGGLSGNR
jgi:hypothetical protein